MLQDSPNSTEFSPHGWGKPMEDGGCGVNLEYEAPFLELKQALLGKPETQFSQAQPPEWSKVIHLAERCFEFTRDIRVVVAWAEARLATEGLSSLPNTLRLLSNLLIEAWVDLHPQPDDQDGDLFERVAALEELGAKSRFHQTLREATAFTAPNHGDVVVKEIEYALEKSTPLDNTEVISVNTMQTMLSALEGSPQYQALIDLPVAIEGLQAVLLEQFGVREAPNLSNLTELAQTLRRLIPPAALNVSLDNEAPPTLSFNAPQASDNAGNQEVKPSKSANLVHLDQIHNRADAARAIDAVCHYLEQVEPANPAQFLLKRARRLLNADFLHAVKDLNPDVANDIARLLGVDPHEFFTQSNSD